MLARLAIRHPRILPQQVCFHAQQAVEKALKAVLIFHKVDFPLTHDIEELIEIAGQSHIVLSSDVRKAGLLTPFAVETRYPGYGDDLEDTEVREAVQLAEKVLAWAQKLIALRSRRKDTRRR